MKRTFLHDAMLSVALFLATIAVNYITKISDQLGDLHTKIATIVERLVQHEKRLDVLEHEYDKKGKKDGMEGLPR